MILTEGRLSLRRERNRGGRLKQGMTGTDTSDHERSFLLTRFFTRVSYSGMYVELMFSRCPMGVPSLGERGIDCKQKNQKYTSGLPIGQNLGIRACSSPDFFRG